MRTAGRSGGGKLRVLVIGHTYMLRQNQQKWAALSAFRPAEVSVVAPERWPNRVWGKTFPFEPPLAPVSGRALPVFFPGSKGGHFYRPDRLLRFASRFCPDLIQVEQECFSASAFEAAVLARMLDKPFAVFCWENVDRPLSALRRLSMRFVFETAGLILAGGESTAHLLRRWGYGGRLTVVPQLGVPLLASAPRRRGRNRTLEIGYAGRLVHEKGVDLLLRATAILHAQGYPVRLSLCGAGPEREHLERLAVETGIADRVRWLGALSHQEVEEFLTEIEVLALPSRTAPRWCEQFGHVLVEAMAAGLPVVGSSCGEIPNVIGRPDLVFPEEDVFQLAFLLSQFLRSDAFYQECAAYCYRRAQDLFLHQRIAERTWDAWLSAFPGLERRLRRAVTVEG